MNCNGVPANDAVGPGASRTCTSLPEGGGRGRPRARPRRRCRNTTHAAVAATDLESTPPDTGGTPGVHRRPPSRTTRPPDDRTGPGRPTPPANPRDRKSTADEPRGDREDADHHRDTARAAGHGRCAPRASQDSVSSARARTGQRPSENQQGQAQRHGQGVEITAPHRDLLVQLRGLVEEGTPSPAGPRRRRPRTEGWVARKHPPGYSAASIPHGERSRSPATGDEAHPHHQHQGEEPDEAKGPMVGNRRRCGPE